MVNDPDIPLLQSDPQDMPVDDLIDALGDPGSREQAAQQLISAGEEVVPALLKAMHDDDQNWLENENHHTATAINGVFVHFVQFVHIENSQKIQTISLGALATLHSMLLI